MKLYLLALTTAAVVVVVLVMLLRTRRLKEKYAAIWLVLAVGVCIIGAFPAAVAAVARTVGVATSSNLLFAAALAVLFGVCIQLSIELSSTEEETRTLTEEVALLRLDLDRLTQERRAAVPADRTDRLPDAESAERTESVETDGGHGGEGGHGG